MLNVQPIFAGTGRGTESLEALPLDQPLPRELEASEPPEARGLSRDEVRLMVSYRDDDRVVHSRFRDLGDFLEAGDVLVINTSATMNAAVGASARTARSLELHSTHLPGGLWIVELRRAMEPFRDAAPGETLLLPEGLPSRYTPHPGRDRPAEGSRPALPSTCRDRSTSTSNGTGPRSATATSGELAR